MNRFAFVSMAAFVVMTVSLLIGFVEWGDSDSPDAGIPGEKDDSLRAIVDATELEERQEVDSERSGEDLLADGDEIEAISYREHVDRIQEFSHRHGLFSDDDLLEYESYSNEALSPLIARGDLKAIQVMASRAAQAGNIELKRDLYFWSAVHGGTMGLTFSALELIDRGVDEGRVVDRDAMIDAFASLEVAAKRGFLNSLRTGFYFMDRYEISLTQSDQEAISRRAEELYDGFSDVRADLGLEPFDNSISTPMLLGMQEDFPLSKNPSGWGTKYYQ